MEYSEFQNVNISELFANLQSENGRIMNHLSVTFQEVKRFIDEMNKVLVAQDILSKNIYGLFNIVNNHIQYKDRIIYNLSTQLHQNQCPNNNELRLSLPYPSVFRNDNLVTTQNCMSVEAQKETVIQTFANCNLQQTHRVYSGKRGRVVRKTSTPNRTSVHKPLQTGEQSLDLRVNNNRQSSSSEPWLMRSTMQNSSTGLTEKSLQVSNNENCATSSNEVLDTVLIDFVPKSECMDIEDDNSCDNQSRVNVPEEMIEQGNCISFDQSVSRVERILVERAKLATFQEKSSSTIVREIVEKSKIFKSNQLKQSPLYKNIRKVDKEQSSLRFAMDITSTSILEERQQPLSSTNNTMKEQQLHKGKVSFLGKQPLVKVVQVPEATKSKTDHESVNQHLPAVGNIGGKQKDKKNLITSHKASANADVEKIPEKSVMNCEKPAPCTSKRMNNEETRKDNVSLTHMQKTLPKVVKKIHAGSANSQTDVESTKKVLSAVTNIQNKNNDQINLHTSDKPSSPTRNSKSELKDDKVNPSNVDKAQSENVAEKISRKDNCESNNQPSSSTSSIIDKKNDNEIKLSRSDKQSSVKTAEGAKSKPDHEDPKQLSPSSKNIMKNYEGTTEKVSIFAKESPIKVARETLPKDTKSRSELSATNKPSSLNVVEETLPEVTKSKLDESNDGKPQELASNASSQLTKQDADACNSIDNPSGKVVTAQMSNESSPTDESNRDKDEELLTNAGDAKRKTRRSFTIQQPLVDVASKPKEQLYHRRSKRLSLNTGKQASANIAQLKECFKAYNESINSTTAKKATEASILSKRSTVKGIRQMHDEISKGDEEEESAKNKELPSIPSKKIANQDEDPSSLSKEPLVKGAEQESQEISKSKGELNQEEGEELSTIVNNQMADQEVDPLTSNKRKQTPGEADGQMPKENSISKEELNLTKSKQINQSTSNKINVVTPEDVAKLKEESNQRRYKPLSLTVSNTMAKQPEEKVAGQVSKESSMAKEKVNLTKSKQDPLMPSKLKVLSSEEVSKTFIEFQETNPRKYKKLSLTIGNATTKEAVDQSISNNLTEGTTGGPTSKESSTLEEESNLTTGKHDEVSISNKVKVVGPEEDQGKIKLSLTVNNATGKEDIEQSVSSKEAPANVVEQIAEIRSKSKAESNHQDIKLPTFMDKQEINESTSKKTPENSKSNAESICEEIKLTSTVPLAMDKQDIDGSTARNTPTKVGEQMTKESPKSNAESNQAKTKLPSMDKQDTDGPTSNKTPAKVGEHMMKESSKSNTESNREEIKLPSTVPLSMDKQKVGGSTTRNTPTKVGGQMTKESPKSNAESNQAKTKLPSMDKQETDGPTSNKTPVKVGEQMTNESPKSNITSNREEIKVPSLDKQEIDESTLRKTPAKVGVQTTKETSKSNAESNQAKTKLPSMDKQETDGPTSNKTPAKVGGQMRKESPKAELNQAKTKLPSVDKQETDGPTSNKTPAKVGEQMTKESPKSNAESNQAITKLPSVDTQEIDESTLRKTPAKVRGQMTKETSKSSAESNRAEIKLPSTPPVSMDKQEIDESISKNTPTKVRGQMTKESPKSNAESNQAKTKLPSVDNEEIQKTPPTVVQVTAKETSMSNDKTNRSSQSFDSDSDDRLFIDESFFEASPPPAKERDRKKRKQRSPRLSNAPKRREIDRASLPTNAKQSAEKGAKVAKRKKNVSLASSRNETSKKPKVDEQPTQNKSFYEPISDDEREEPPRSKTNMDLVTRTLSLLDGAESHDASVTFDPPRPLLTAQDLRRCLESPSTSKNARRESVVPSTPSTSAESGTDCTQIGSNLIDVVPTVHRRPYVLLQRLAICDDALDRSSDEKVCKNVADDRAIVASPKTGEAKENREPASDEVKLHVSNDSIDGLCNLSSSTSFDGSPAVAALATSTRSNSLLRKRRRCVVRLNT